MGLHGANGASGYADEAGDRAWHLDGYMRLGTFVAYHLEGGSLETTPTGFTNEVQQRQ